jgi:hypothetical protein
MKGLSTDNRGWKGNPRVGSVRKDPLRTLANTKFEHMGLSIDPCEYMVNTYVKPIDNSPLTKNSF